MPPEQDEGIKIMMPPDRDDEVKITFPPEHGDDFTPVITFKD
jgi:hypothetical protein